MKTSILALFLLCTSCAIPIDALLGNTLREEFSIDGVKLIYPSMAKPDASDSFAQATYQIDANRRLLLRFESFSRKASEVVLTEKEGVEIQVGLLAGQDPTQAVASLKLCPILKNWMMLATWDAAHPFHSSGRWSKPGGDYDVSECMSAQAKPKEGATVIPLVFNVTSWFRNTVRGRGQDLGLVLIADRSWEIAGDQSTSYSPRISYRK